MMKKDKKPFTYTPGGIDLSEIRSPRMARRIERNANLPGVDELPRQTNPYAAQPGGPLPPSALAAMQSALPVQVFPTGPPQPPPPPPPKHTIPGPPPPPMPIKPASNGQQVYERPDMTQIIPENPMSLLRKAPKVERKTFLDELYQGPGTGNTNYAATPPVQPQSPPSYQQSPTTNQRTHSPPTKTSSAQLGSLYIPPVNNVSQKQESRATPPTPPQRQSQSNSPAPQSPALNKAPTPWLTQKHDKQPEKPAWAIRDEPSNQQSFPMQQQSPSMQHQSPPIQQQSPPIQHQSPPIQQQSQFSAPKPESPRTWAPKQEAPQPWTQQKPQQPPNPRPWSQQEPTKPQSRPQQTNIPQNSSGVVRVAPPQYNPPLSAPAPGPDRDIVWVTQPQVLQHPGPAPQYNQQQQTKTQQRVQSKTETTSGVRIIPIQIEGANNQRQPGTPITPGNER